MSNDPQTTVQVDDTQTPAPLPAEDHAPASEPEQSSQSTQSEDAYIESLLKGEDPSPELKGEDPNPEADKADLKEAASDASEDTPEGEEGETETEGEPETPTITAPQSMSAADREKFAALSPDLQKWVSDREKQREADYTRKTTELATERKALGDLEQVIAPRRAAIKQAGLNESTAIGQLFALHELANQNPVGFARYLLEQNGLTPDHLNAGPTTPTDPQVAVLQQRLQNLEQTQQATRLTEAQAAYNEVATNAKEYPFFAEVENQLPPLIEALHAQKPSASLQDRLAIAYKMAVAATPDVAAKIEQGRQQTAEAERLAKVKAATSKAKKAASGNVKGRGVMPVKPNLSQDEFIATLLERTD